MALNRFDLNLRADKIAASYNGCILDGKIERLDKRVNLNFQTIQCEKKSANQIKGVAVSIEDMKIGLINNPKIGTFLNVLVVDNYEK